MIKRKVSVILFHDKEGNILLQDRRSTSKHGEEFGFFGGKIEEGEKVGWQKKKLVKIVN